MFTPYLLVLTMFSGAGEFIDPDPHASLASCESELAVMTSLVEEEWAMHGILRTKGECRDYDPESWNLTAGRRPAERSDLVAQSAD